MWKHSETSGTLRMKWDNIFKVMKRKNLQLRMLYSVRLSHRLDGEIKSFTEKQKLRELNTTRPALQQALKELLQQGKDQKLKTTLYIIQTAIPKPYGEQQRQKQQQIHTQKRKSNPSITLKTVLKQETGTKEEGEKNDLQKQTQNA